MYLRPQELHFFVWPEVVTVLCTTMHQLLRKTMIFCFKAAEKEEEKNGNLFKQDDR